MPYFIHHGHRLFYREQGRGPLLVILPGNTASSACHDGELDHFGQRYHAVALDFLGSGRSDRVAVWAHDWWAEGAMAVVALLDQLGAERAAIVGTSGGAAVALLLAIAASQRVGAVIADSVVAQIPPAELRALLAERALRTEGQVAFWSAAHGDDWPQVVDADTAMIAGHGATGLDYFQGRLGQVACPVLLTASLTDSLLPDVGPQLCVMAQQIAHSRLLLVNAGDHPLMWSRPADFRAAADAFLGMLQH